MANSECRGVRPVHRPWASSATIGRRDPLMAAENIKDRNMNGPAADLTNPKQETSHPSIPILPVTLSLWPPGFMKTQDSTDAKLLRCIKGSPRHSPSAANFILKSLTSKSTQKPFDHDRPLTPLFAVEFRNMSHFQTSRRFGHAGFRKSRLRGSEALASRLSLPDSKSASSSKGMAAISTRVGIATLEAENAAGLAKIGKHQVFCEHASQSSKPNTDCKITMSCKVLGCLKANDHDRSASILFCGNELKKDHWHQLSKVRVMHVHVHIESRVHPMHV